MRVLRFSWLGVGAAVALSVGLAFAQGPVSPYPECNKKPTPADIEGAKGAHKAASQFYDRGDYDRAIRYWADAYGFDCTAHGVLLNIANAYEKKGDKSSAITALETYLKRAGGDNTTIEERVKNLKASMAPAPTATQVPTAAPTAAPTAVPTAAPTAVEPTGPRPYGYKPWIVVGAGGAIAIIGAILVPVGIASYADAESRCPDHKVNPNAVCPPDVASQGNSARITSGIGWAALGVGVASAAGGLVWQFVYNKPSAAGPTTGVKVLPAIAPGHYGASLQGAF